MTQEILAKAYEPGDVEEKWYRTWEEQGYFHPSADTPKMPFCITIPPPNVTGSLHMGHAMYVIQDVLVRYYRMQAYNTLWLPGVDHAGIATQLVVERTLAKEEGIASRHDLGRDAFLERIWRWKEKSGNRISKQLKVLGFSLDWQRSRFTMDEGFSRAVKEAFVRLYEEGLIYRAYRLINWCTRCFTALSDLEVETTDVDGKIWHIAYPVVDANKGEQLIVATTRPETIFGDTAVAVHPEDPRFQHLIGKRVRVPLTERTIPVIADPILVSMEFGTGAVKVTPAHDFNDFETGQRHKLEQISVFTPQGKLNENAPKEFQELSIAEARKKALTLLEERGLLASEKPHKIGLGQCSRCDTVVEPLLSMQWFVKTEPLAKPAIEAVEQGKTKFVPANFTDDYFRWMRNIKDWCISRQLWWGHRIPAWYDKDDETKVYVARTEEEAQKQAGHKNLRQDDDVLDTWFSSALWPFATLGWPDPTRDLKTFYPNTVMETGHDILFFWVARMMMMGMHFMKKAPFQTVLLHALVVDENGEKMSKVKGNVIDPLHLVYGATIDEVLGFSQEKLPSKKEKEEAFAKYKKAFPQAAATYPNGFPKLGADALRFFLLVMGSQGRNIRLSIPRIEGYRHFLNKLWSASRFFLMYSGGLDMDAFLESLQKAKSLDHFGLAERWILSRLHEVIGEVNEAIASFQLSEAAQKLYQFFWNEVCDWYIEMCKPQLQSTEQDPESLQAKKMTQGTLAVVLEVCMRLLHPMIPFVTEEIWTKLPRYHGSPDSLMITLYPSREEKFIDREVSEHMQKIQLAVSTIRSIRSTYQLTQNDIQFLVKVADEKTRKLLNTYRDLIGLLARTSQVEVVAEEPRGKGSLVYVVEGMTVILPDAGKWLDLPRETARLEKEEQKCEQEQTTLKGRLQNEDFLKRAKPEVVVTTQNRVVELDQQLGEIRKQKQVLASI